MVHSRPVTQPVSAPSARDAGTTGVAARWPLVSGVLALVALVWAYWPTLVELFKDWQNDPNYSVGQIVPLAAAYLAWQDRDKLRRCAVRPSYWGLALLAAATALHLFGLLFFYVSLERYAFVLSVAGLVLLLYGREVFWQLRWILAFLLLMVPLPGAVHNRISNPLQTFATAGAVFLLEVFGVMVSREGNVMLLNGQTEVAVAEACSGLRMLTAFVVVAAVLAYLIRAPRWQKIVLLISSVPVAIACNLLRLVATAVLYMVAESSVAETFFHDFAGLTMMPLAIAMLLGELWLLRRLVIEEPETAAPGRPGRG